jgi:hypothetical protein
VPARGVIMQAEASGAAPVAPEEVRCHPAFIAEDVRPRVADREPRAPAPASRGDVRPALFVGVYRFF